jgi:DNA-binding GntR family transcriptional regulator
MPKERLEISTTVADRTAEVIRERILAQAPGFLPGQRLFPLSLGDELGVSATPVHQALDRLAAEGLVDVVPRRGTYVAQLSTEDLDDLLSVRAGLELLAFRFRAGHLSAEELATLESSLDRCEQAITVDDSAMYRAAEWQFHQLLVAVGHSPRLLALSQSLLKQAQISEAYYPRQTDEMRESVAEHRRLMEVLSKGDLSHSEAALVAHWERSAARVRRQFGDHLRTPAVPDRLAESANGSVARLKE